jgi:hypothetical protein
MNDLLFLKLKLVGAFHQKVPTNFNFFCEITKSQRTFILFYTLNELNFP